METRRIASFPSIENRFFVSITHRRSPGAPLLRERVSPLTDSRFISLTKDMSALTLWGAQVGIYHPLFKLRLSFAHFFRYGKVQWV